MLDTAYGELLTTYSLDAGWRPAVEVSARDSWDFYQRHPWVLQVSGAQALLGPHEFDLYEMPDAHPPRRRARVRPAQPARRHHAYTVQDALDTFEFGLQRLLDGIEAFIESRSL
ncbi:MAG: hypothetical protein GEV08_02180 [Acidimicrobiia bacterium]|nr:hypothetical protein [Acidimicrobiia bacterium]